MNNEKSIWIAKGIVVSNDRTESQVREKTDPLLVETIYPLVKSLKKEGLAKRWYSSRRGPGNAEYKTRARIYIETTPNKSAEVVKRINESAGKHEVIDEDLPDLSSSNIDILQRASQLALEILPRAINTNRDSEEFFSEIDKIVEQNTDIRNHDGIHWLENNLGYRTGTLLNRYGL